MFYIIKKNKFMRTQHKLNWVFIVVLILLQVDVLSAQKIQDTIIYDFDNQIYKQTINGMESYFDLNGEIQNIISGNIKFDSVPIYKEMNRVINFPPQYVDSGYGSTASVWFSLIIEPDGTVTNFRILKAFKGKLKKNDFMFENPVFPNVYPVKIDGKPVKAEVVKEFVTTILYGGKREKKTLNYTIKNKYRDTLKTEYK